MSFMLPIPSSGKRFTAQGELTSMTTSSIGRTFLAPIFATPDHNLHRLRKAPLLPLFSKKRISDFEPVIHEKLDIFCCKIDQYIASGGHFALNRAVTAFSGDVITTYVFGQSYQHLESPDFKETFHEPFMAASEAGHMALQFKWIYPMMEALPERLVLKMQPLVYLILQLAKVGTLLEYNEAC